jgi:tetratricopeptide (TPR) repeat protein
MTHKEFQSFKNVLLLISCVSVASIFMLTCDTCLAGTLSQARAKFYHANTYYSEGEYDKAIEAYNQALNSGFESGNFYYNLANSYFKKGQLGEAILNYEKAMRLIPRDSDLRSTYEYARSLIKGGALETKEQGYRIVLDKIFSLFTIDGLAFSLALLFTGILLAILLSMYTPAIRKYRVGTLAVLIFVSTLFSIVLFEKASKVGKEAIIVVKNTDAKFEPFDSATTHFTLYEGSKVAIVSPKGSWYKIERSDGKTGWVKNSDLGVF